MEKPYSHTCPRCGIDKTYLTKRHWESLTQKPYCTFCKGIPDDTLGLFVSQRIYAVRCKRCQHLAEYTKKNSLLYSVRFQKNECVKCKGIPEDSLSELNRNIFSLHCRRCNRIKEYASKNALVNAARFQKHDCVSCRGIPDATLKLFIVKGIFARICPKCQSVVEHSTKPVLRAAIRANHQCHSCAASVTGESNHRLLRAQWTPIIGYENYTYKTLEMVRNHWETLNETERRGILNRTPKQRYYYWGHLKRKNRTTGYRLCRETMAEKYSGDNHWIRRPEVYLKILKSCEKYKGIGHWFRNKRKNLTTPQPVI